MSGMTLTSNAYATRGERSRCELPSRHKRRLGAAQGVESIRRRDADSAGALDRWLHDVVNEYTKRILPVDLRIAEEWGRMNVPDPLPVIDGLLAATARVHGLTLVTRNVKDMARVGIPCLDPFAVVG